MPAHGNPCGNLSNGVSMNESQTPPAKKNKPLHILGALILGTVIAWGIPKVMNADKRAVNSFVKSYNAFENTMEVFIKFNGERLNEKLPEDALTGVLYNPDALANKEKSGCDAIPDEALKSECKTAFGQYYALMKSIEADGLTEASLMKARELRPAIDAVVDKIVKKYRLKVTEK